jgi:hypothetical protein
MPRGHRSSFGGNAIGPRTALALELAAKGLTVDEIGVRMHIGRKTVQNLLGRGNGAPRLDPLDALDDTTPGCVRCGLRGPHECLRGSGEDRRGEAT